MEMKQNPDIFLWDILKSDKISFLSENIKVFLKILKYFNNFQNRNFSFL